MYNFLIKIPIEQIKRKRGDEEFVCKRQFYETPIAHGTPRYRVTNRDETDHFDVMES
jgi:hypothetical protein